MSNQQHRACAQPSVVFIAKDEEHAIFRAVSSAKAHFESVHVVDSGSSDATCELAASAGATVHQFEWNGQYPKKKQWCLDHIDVGRGWVLLLDADEIVTDAFAAEVMRVLVKSKNHQEAVAWDAPISYVFAGRALAHGYTVRKRVLLKRARVHFPEVGDLEAPGITEVEGHYQPDVNGSVGSLRVRLTHDDPDPVSSWFRRHNNYSDWEAWVARNPVVQDRIRRAKSRQGATFDRLPFKGLSFFIYAYIYKLGFLDGRAGLDYALAQSWYRWQIRLKVRENAARSDDSSSLTRGRTGSNAASVPAAGADGS